MTVGWTLQVIFYLSMFTQQLKSLKSHIPIFVFYLCLGHFIIILFMFRTLCTILHIYHNWTQFQRHHPRGNSWQETDKQELSSDGERRVCQNYGCSLTRNTSQSGDRCAQTDICIAKLVYALTQTTVIFKMFLYFTRVINTNRQSFVF